MAPYYGPAGSGNLTDELGTRWRLGVNSGGVLSTVVIPEAPGAPTNVVATPGDGSASVAFTPGPEHGATVTTYTVTANPGGATATGSASPITVTGLTNGTSYTFTVAATNSVGTSSASGATTPTVPVRPSADGRSIPRAIPMTNSSGQAVSDSTTTVASSGEPDQHPMWGKFTATTSVVVSVDTIGSNYDTFMVVYSGPANATTFSQLTLVASNDDGGGASQSKITFLTDPGTTYYVLGRDFDSPGSGSGSATMTLNWANVNGVAPAAGTMTFSALPITLPNGSATHHYQANDVTYVVPYDEPVQTFWATFVPTTAAPITLTGTGGSGSLIRYGAPGLVRHNYQLDDFPQSANPITFTPTIGKRYYVRYFSSTGTATLTWSS